MRTITDHKLNGLNEAIFITVLDEPGHGGACHKYAIELASGGPNNDSASTTLINFQNGPIKEAGVNGISQEALLAVVIDRLRCFQEGPFASDDNQEALVNCLSALECLQRRTLERMARGVEGTNQK